MKSLSAAGLVAFVARWITVVYSDKHPVTFERKRYRVVGDGHRPALLVDDFNGQMNDPVAIRRDDFPVGGQAYCRRLPRRSNFNRRRNLCLFDSYGLEYARFIGNVPR